MASLLLATTVTSHKRLHIEVRHKIIVNVVGNTSTCIFSV